MVTPPYPCVSVGPLLSLVLVVLCAECQKPTIGREGGSEDGREEGRKGRKKGEREGREEELNLRYLPPFLLLHLKRPNLRASEVSFQHRVFDSANQSHV